MKRGAFTLIEMMVAIVIFSLIVISLYKSYDALKESNQKYSKITEEMEHLWRIKRVLYLDFALTLKSNVKVLNQERNRDIVLLQTSNSIHNRFNPFVAYVVKNGVLYRLESLYKLHYPFDTQTVADVDRIGKVKRFRIYKALKKEGQRVISYYLIDILFSDKTKILYKIRALNEV
ncbi:hypothetical protein MNB_SM-7-1002 [hydrothermal vent metagenome]|uniref:Prepilin-type N-terminal cleavage/methylation domain-containing protein n=1 Tax=hydrothermal vent metagenome TaxID=652676 RepID=A0A1W1BKK8_9ZZZZ